MPSAKRVIPKWTKAPGELVARFASVVQPLAGVQTRKMFGYPAAFIHGQMFAGLFQDSMILRLDQEGRAELAREYGPTPFEPMPGRTMREYVVVPRGLLLGSGAGLAAWLEKARDYAASLPPRGRVKGKGAKGRRPAR